MNHWSSHTHGRTVTTSSLGLRGRHSDSGIHTTPLAVDHVGPESSIQPPPIPSRLPVQHTGSRPIGPTAVGFYIRGLVVVRISRCFSYSSQHMDYYGSSGHVPSYTLGLFEHSGDKDGEKTVQARGDDVNHVHGEGDGEEDVSMGGGGTIAAVPLPSSGSRPGKGKEVKFLRDRARSETGFGSQSRPSSG
ncbi:hypothetical protein M9H77_33946 [Catharanthus roseus]|uniref:Uncharacterized protein n=1 Tax=Catharanthus roseus TaxID=4058 RepID=A0ACB9ZKZ4_CATRO|nr:hypothetical protein M9H77_33946 [Catharanthus roseus]